MRGLAGPGERRQILTLARTFLARFFDNELSDGSTDLRHAFIWLLSALAMPGLIVPHVKMGPWAMVAMARGPEGGVEYLRMSSSIDKVFVLGTTMVVMSVLAAVVWQSLLIDRRDVLVLGSFPIRRRVVLAAKFGALAAFFGIVTVGMHAGGALLYGFYLGGLGGFLFGLRLIVAHFLASAAAGLFTYLLVIAAQGALLTIAGPRLFSRLAPVLQLSLVVLAILMFALLPLTSSASRGAIYHLTARSMDWVLWMPPVWFFGLYETVQGTSLPILHQLAARSCMALCAVGVVAAATYPLAYRRVMLDALVGTAVPARRSIVHRLAAHVPSLLSRASVGRATLQFAMSTLGRVGLHRLIVAITAGVGVAIAVPIVASNLGVSAPAPTPGLLALPIALILFLLVGLRIAIALPAELPAAWIFAASAGRGYRWHRLAVRRLLWATGILPPLVATLPAYWAVWGGRIAVSHALVCVAAGVVLTELLLLGFTGMPCARPYTPGAARLQARWPWYLMVVVVLTIEIPQVEAALLPTPLGAPTLAAVLGGVAFAIRGWAERRLPRPDVLANATGEVITLDLH